MPLQNGVNSIDTIKKLFPENRVYQACVYIVARLLEPGVVQESGIACKLYFGSETETQQNLEKLLDIFKKAEIDAVLSPDINKVIWEKFLFISPIATMTSFADKSIGAVLENKELVDTLQKMIWELYGVANAKGIIFPEEILGKTYHKMEILPYEATTSLRSDFQKGGKTELETLTGYVVHQAHTLGMQVPNYEKLYNELKSRI